MEFNKLQNLDTVKSATDEDTPFELSIFSTKMAPGRGRHNLEHAETISALVGSFALFSALCSLSHFFPSAHHDISHAPANSSEPVEAVRTIASFFSVSFSLSVKFLNLLFAPLSDSRFRAYGVVQTIRNTLSHVRIELCLSHLSS